MVISQLDVCNLVVGKVIKNLVFSTMHNKLLLEEIELNDGTIINLEGIHNEAYIASIVDSVDDKCKYPVADASKR